MSVNIIVAYNENRIIGNKGQIPWRLPEDMDHFKKITSGCPVIMGRKTWESIPSKFRPLSNRTNIVITSNINYKSSPQPDVIAIDVSYGIDVAEDFFPEKDTWIIGGGEIYRQALEQGLVDNVYASEIAGKHEGDTFFPELDTADWTPTTLKQLDGFQIVHWKRRIDS